MKVKSTVHRRDAIFVGGEHSFVRFPGFAHSALWWKWNESEEDRTVSNSSLTQDLISFHYILSTWYGRNLIENTACNSYFTVERKFVVLDMRLPSRCLAMAANTHEIIYIQLNEHQSTDVHVMLGTWYGKLQQPLKYSVCLQVHSSLFSWRKRLYTSVRLGRLADVLGR
jgi:hypothetical protein